MTFNYKYLVLTLISLICQNLQSQPEIKGQIKIDTTVWTPIAYLSIISNFDEINTMSNEMIIEKTDIDLLGMFSFDTKYLPKEDHLYRIHISRKNDPPASLIIGGKDENHFLLIANNQSIIHIKDSCNNEFIKDVRIYGYYANEMIHQIDEIAIYLDSTNFNGSYIKIELIRNAIFEKLRLFADTCSNPLVSLYALYKSKFEKNYPVNQQFYKDFLLKWKQEQSSYFDEFRKKIPLSKDNRMIFLTSIGLSLFLIGFLSCLAIIKLFKKDQNILKDLSVQERKIFTLIMEGKSNKEISDSLNIGLSTVKSHVNSIYSKLNIKSRKDALNLHSDKNDILT